MKAILIMSAFLLLVGCGEQTLAPAEPPPSAQPADEATGKTLGRQAVEGLTGKTAVDAGERMKTKIGVINAARQEDKDDINEATAP